MKIFNCNKKKQNSQISEMFIIKFKSIMKKKSFSLKHHKIIKEAEQFLNDLL